MRDHYGNQESAVCMEEAIKVIRSPLYGKDHQGNHEFSVCMKEMSQGMCI